MTDPIAHSYLSAAGRQELPALTGLRIVATLAVVGWHSAQLMPAFVAPATHGYLGVDLFFILSGFVISHVYWADFLQPTGRTYIRFVALRLARLWPAHMAAALLFVALLLAAALRQSKPIPLDPLAGEVLLQVFLAQNWGFTDDILINYPTWSVSAEFLAYLLFPLQVALFRPVHSLPALLLAIPLALALCWLGMGWWLNLPLNHTGPEANIRVLCEFAMGVALYRLWHGGRLAALPWPAIVLAAALGMLALTIVTPPRHWADYVIVLLMTPLLLGLAHGGGWLGKLLASRPMVYLGEISYSVYLVHASAIFLVPPLANLLRPIVGERQTGWDFAAAAVLLSLAGGALLFHLIEKPARTWLRARIERGPLAAQPQSA